MGNELNEEDIRPAFVLDDVKGAAFNLVKAQGTSGVPAFRLKNVTDFSLFHSEGLPDTQLSQAPAEEF
jgi:hypothetical protein